MHAELSNAPEEDATELDRVASPSDQSYRCCLPLSFNVYQAPIRLSTSMGVNVYGRSMLRWDLGVV
jgi:hypothetical protein